MLSMQCLKQKTTTEEQEIGLLREWLPRIGGKDRAYIKGATQALLYAQEEPEKIAAASKEFYHEAD